MDVNIKEERLKFILKYKIWLILVFIPLLFAHKYYLGVEQIGHFWEKEDNYTVSYYANLFKDKDYAKNYRVRADLERFDTGNERVIRLDRVYFPNGGNLSFEDYDCELVINKKILCRDNDLGEWYVELTNEKLSSF